MSRNIFKAVRIGSEGAEYEFYLQADSLKKVQSTPGVDLAHEVQVKDLSQDPDKAAYYVATIQFGAYGMHMNLAQRFYFAEDEQAIREHVKRKVAEKWHMVPETIAITKIHLLTVEEWMNRHKGVNEIEEQEKKLQQELERVRKQLREARACEFGCAANQADPK